VVLICCGATMLPCDGVSEDRVLDITDFGANALGRCLYQGAGKAEYADGSLPEYMPTVEIFLATVGMVELATISR
jgi:hypothetical protein